MYVCVSAPEIATHARDRRLRAVTSLLRCCPLLPSPPLLPLLEISQVTCLHRRPGVWRDEEEVHVVRREGVRLGAREGVRRVAVHCLVHATPQ